MTVVSSLSLVDWVAAHACQPNYKERSSLMDSGRSAGIRIRNPLSSSPYSTNILRDTRIHTSPGRAATMTLGRYGGGVLIKTGSGVEFGIRLILWRLVGLPRTLWEWFAWRTLGPTRPMWNSPCQWSITRWLVCMQQPRGPLQLRCDCAF